MKKSAKFIFTHLIIALVLSLSPAYGFFDESVDDIIAAASSDTVEGISATAGNGSIILIWNSKHNSENEEAQKYRVEYGTQSVQKGFAEAYESTKTTIDNVPSIKIDDLENNTKYYFTVIAIFEDASETPPSDEVSATPISSLEENISETPVVISAESAGSKIVRVLFSEDIILPKENVELAFAITEESHPDILLEVIGVSYDIDPTTKKEVLSDVLITTTEELAEETEYRITVSAQITDTEGNPIESGSTDSAVFLGFSGDSEIIPNVVVSGEENEEIQPGEGLTLDDILSEIEDKELSGSEKDTTPPEDITNLIAGFKARLTDFLVTLSWMPSIDSAKDLSDQLLYRSEDMGNQWSIGVSLGKDTTKTNVPEKPKTEVTYKITTKDISGNESVGIIRSISIPELPTTGSGMLMVTGIAILGAGIRKYRKF